MACFRWLAAVALMMVCLPVAAGDWEYSVRPGESLWRIAARFCGSHRHAETLLRHNGLADAAALRAGSVLRIPVDCLVMQPASARVVEAGPGLRLLRDGASIAAAAGQPVEMGDTLVTAEGFAIIEFADGSRLTVRPHGEIQFILLSSHGASGMVDTLTRLRKGRVQHRVDGNDGRVSPEHRHRIATPVGAAAVRGTQYRVELPGDGKTTLATTRGSVDFGPVAAAPIVVPAGTGVVATADSAAREDLLPAPTLSAALRKGQGRKVEWPEVAGARAYRVTLSGAGMPLGEAVVDSPFWQVDTEPGHYTFSVRGIAASDLEGLDASVPLEVIPAGPSGLGSERVAKNRDAVRLRWSATGTGPFTARIEGGGKPVELAAQRELAETRLPPGVYRWRVKSADSDWSDPAEFVVVPAQVIDPGAQRNRPSEPLVVSWQPPAHDVSGYRLRISASGRTLVDRQVSATGVALDEMTGVRCAPCTLEVATAAAGLESDYTAFEYRDRAGHPWPLYVVLTLLLIGL
jgi:hypothetical protein